MHNRIKKNIHVYNKGINYYFSENRAQNFLHSKTVCFFILTSFALVLKLLSLFQHSNKNLHHFMHVALPLINLSSVIIFILFYPNFCNLLIYHCCFHLYLLSFIPDGHSIGYILTIFN